MGAKANKDKEGPSKELLEQCKKDVHRALSSAVKALFDGEGGEDGGDFYAHILMQMDRIFDDPRIPTAAVSITNKINLYINSYFFVHQITEEVKDPETGKVIQPALDLKKESDKRLLRQRRAAILQHEILHCIFHHMSRGADFGNPQLANFAADLVVNSCIKEDILGKQFLYPQKFGLEKDKSLDFYYTNFPIDEHPICMSPNKHDQQHQQKQQSGGSGQQGDQQQGQGDQQGQGNNDGQGGQGQGDQQGQGGGNDSSDGHGHDHAVDAEGKCTECGGLRTFDNHEVWTEDGASHMSDTMRESLINDAIGRAANATKNAGKLPQAVQDRIALAKKKPQIPWQTILKQFVARLSNASLYHTKRRPSKRFKTFPGIRLRPKLKLGVGTDVSGSISDKEYEVFLNEIFAIARAVGGEVEVVEWDTAIQGVYKIKGYKPNITRHGAGGTDPTEAIEYFNKRKHKFDGVIMFTDGHLFGEVTKGLRVPGMWVITADGTKECLKKARVIKLPKTESSDVAS